MLLLTYSIINSIQIGIVIDYRLTKIMFQSNYTVLQNLIN